MVYVHRNIRATQQLYQIFPFFESEVNFSSIRSFLDDANQTWAASSQSFSGL